MSYLGNGVASEVHAGAEGEEGCRSGKKSEEMPGFGGGSAGAVEEREVGGEEQHEPGSLEGHPWESLISKAAHIAESSIYLRVWAGAVKGSVVAGEREAVDDSMPLF